MESAKGFLSSQTSLQQQAKKSRLPQLFEEMVLGIDRFMHCTASAEEEDLFWVTLNTAVQYLHELGLIRDAKQLEQIIVQFREEVQALRSNAILSSPLSSDASLEPIFGLLRKVWDVLRLLSELRRTLEQLDQSQGGQPTGNPEKNLNHQVTCSSDFRSVNWYGTQYTFTPTQAACFRVLWESWQRGTPGLGEQTILEEAESQSQRLIYLFKKGRHPAWGTLIIPGDGKGMFRLQEPPATSPPAPCSPTADVTKDSL